MELPLRPEREAWRGPGSISNGREMVVLRRRHWHHLAAVGFNIEDDSTHHDTVMPDYEPRREDVVLLALQGPDIGCRFMVPVNGGIIGRGVEVAVGLSDPNVSREHARIEFDVNGRLMVHDLSSRNGVFINGAQVGRGELVDGNHLQLSTDTVLRVRFQHPIETGMLDEMAGARLTDPMTRLPNRRYLIDRLAQELSFSRRHKEALSVVMFDVDDIAQVLKTDGPSGCARLMATIAELVREGSRFEDVVASYGQDEVVVVLRCTALDEAQRYAERLTGLIRARAFDVGDVAVRATMSAGVAAYEADRFEVDGSITLLDRADSALFRAKSEGKDRVAAWLVEGDESENERSDSESLK